MNVREPAKLRCWLAEAMPRDVAHSIDALRQADDVQHVAVMPDVHLAMDVCIGVALATTQVIYPSAVGNDIGCGMAAVAFDVESSAIDNERAAARLFAGLYESVPSNKHRSKSDWPAALRHFDLSDGRLRRIAERDGRVQLGTLGRGNHFLEFQADQDERLWLMVHSGSRGIGQSIARHHVGQCRSGTNSLPSLEAEGDAGLAYLSDVAWARQYAQESRLAMIRAAEELMRGHFSAAADWESLIDRDHNHVAREEHFGQLWWVHRKGALAAGSGELGLIPGSMGTASFHVSGRGHDESLRSCSHGAGRQKSRAEARQSIGARELSCELDGIWFDHRRSAALRDEAPSAYKDIRQVMRAQRELVRIERELRPMLSYKGT